MQIHIQKNQKEIKEHGTFSFPVNISLEQIQSYETGAFLWHWHPEIELTLILSGKIEYLVGDTTYILSRGDGLFCNSNVLHSGHMKDEMDCSYLSLTFHPRFLYGYENSILHTKYVGSIVSNEAWPSLVLSPNTPWQAEILQILEQIRELYENPGIDYELQLHMHLMYIWQHLYLHFSIQPHRTKKACQHLERLREIISYIENHYTQDISLDDVAKSANICKSECCRFFKKHMGITIFDYILYTRIQNSLPLLTSVSSITEVASLVGFTSPSYYSQIFKRYMKCTPLEYKRNAT